MGPPSRPALNCLCGYFSSVCVLVCLQYIYTVPMKRSSQTIPCSLNRSLSRMPMGLQSRLALNCLCETTSSVCVLVRL